MGILYSILSVLWIYGLYFIEDIIKKLHLPLPISASLAGGLVGLIAVLYFIFFGAAFPE